MRIKPFKAYRPVPELAPKVAFSPNNLMNDHLRKEEARKNPYSFAHIIKPRIDFPNESDKNNQQLFDHARSYFEKLVREGALVRDEVPGMYVYRQTMNEHAQTGLICCSHIDDYLEGRIKKHEHTRADKESENVLHIKSTQLNSNPVFLAYPPVEEIDKEILLITQTRKPDYQFDSELGVLQEVWIIQDSALLQLLSGLFETKVPVSYIADGHHRAAAAALHAKQVALESRSESGFRDYNYFQTCYFPSNQLKIYDYNRLVRDLNKLSVKEFLSKLEEHFEVTIANRIPYAPKKLHCFGMYLKDTWYKLKAKDGSYSNDPLGTLDVTILQNNILNPLLGIQDSRTDKRIDFIAGVKGLSPLEKAVNKGKSDVAFSLFPVTMEQLFAIADMGEVMPPKSTWFEPKLLSGLIIFRME